MENEKKEAYYYICEEVWDGDADEDACYPSVDIFERKAYFMGFQIPIDELLSGIDDSWEGDTRGPVFCHHPDPTTVVLIVKQDNNGSTWVISNKPISSIPNPLGKEGEVIKLLSPEEEFS